MNGQEPKRYDELHEIVEFAIAKEQEAIDFYTQLAGTIRSEAIANELRSMAAMEVVHKQKLQGMNIDIAATTINPKAPNLKIADYQVEVEPSENMTWRDVLNIAMQRELASMNLYNNLARMVMDGKARQLFENLGAEESKHKLYFESIWDQEILTDN